MVNVFRSNYEGYTIDPAATESPERGWALKDAENLKATGKFKQFQPVTAAYLYFHSFVRKS